MPEAQTEGFWYYRCMDQNLNVRDGVAKGTFTEIAVALKKRGLDICDLKSIQQDEYDRLRQLSIQFTKTVELKNKRKRRPKRRKTWYDLFKNIIL